MYMYNVCHRAGCGTIDKNENGIGSGSRERNKVIHLLRGYARSHPKRRGKTAVFQRVLLKSTSTGPVTGELIHKTRCIA